MSPSQNKDFITEANQKIVSFIAKETGFDGIEKPALGSFANALSSYFERVFHQAHRLAELGNRTRPNIYDMTRSLETQGLDLSSFQNHLEQHPTWTPIKTPTKPITVEKTPNFLPSDNEDSDEEEEEEVAPYVPRHLPNFPSKHSFRQTPVKCAI
ncbi:hypothetical protein BD560DRAFT_395495 [Blakeslea trispora]|nr:hypothetical protein BD560DRAFT_395495 [Blakeslea trispora]